MNTSFQRGKFIIILIALCCFVIAVLSSAAEAPENEVQQSPIPAMSHVELAQGQALFQVHCGRCHGMLGAGGEGPSLKRAELPSAPDDMALFAVIGKGIPGTGMPGTWAPNDKELWQIAGYVRSLGRLPPEPVPGDPVQGERLYQGKGNCSSCHIVNGQGRGIGPELTKVGLRRNVEYLRRSLTNPDADQPKRNSGFSGSIYSFLTVRVISLEGEFEGMRINEDEFSIQMRDLSGKTHSFDKSKLINYQRAFGHSLMPGYGRVFSNSEESDLVSYLMGLRGGV